MALVREVLKISTKALEAVGVETPRLDCEILLAHALQASREDLLVRWDENLPSKTLKNFEALIERRKAREPVARITGTQEFWSLSFKVTEATLIPRSDSETLVAAALRKIPEDQPVRILDLGTGSGCLLLAILSERPMASGVGIDVSEKALECARENAKGLGFNNRAEFEKYDWMNDDPKDGKFDLIISNPPYIESEEIKTLAPEVAKFDPAQALDGGKDGLVPYRVLVPLTRGLLKGPGWVIFEIGANQQESVREILTETNFIDLETQKDLAGNPRVIAGFCPFGPL